MEVISSQEQSKFLACSSSIGNFDILWRNSNVLLASNLGFDQILDNANECIFFEVSDNCFASSTPRYEIIVTKISLGNKLKCILKFVFLVFSLSNLKKSRYDNNHTFERECSIVCKKDAQP